MINNKTHFVIITILILLLGIYSYQRIGGNNEEIIDSAEKRTSNSPLKVGNCFSYEEAGVYYGIVLIKYEDDDLYTVALLDKTENKELKKNNFINGALICTSNHMIAPGNYGLSTGFFMKDDLKVFQKNFKYVCQLDLDDSTIEINGGGTLIDNQSIAIKDLRNSNRLLKEMKQYTEPMSKYLN